MDTVSGRLNTEDRGTFLGEFDTGDTIFVLYHNGSYEMTDYEITRRFDPKEIAHIGKFDPDTIVNAVYYDGNKKWTMIKRFKIETTTLDKPYSYITDARSSTLLFVSVKPAPAIKYFHRIKNKKVEEQVEIASFIPTKGWRALGNKLSDQKITGVKELPSPEAKPKAAKTSAKNEDTNTKYKAGDTLDLF